MCEKIIRQMKIRDLTETNWIW